MNYQLEGRSTFYPYRLLWNAAKQSYEQAEDGKMKGLKLQITALVTLAGAMEGYLNYLGFNFDPQAFIRKAGGKRGKLPEGYSLKEKTQWIVEKVNERYDKNFSVRDDLLGKKRVPFGVDCGAKPFQTVQELFDIRNDWMHPKIVEKHFCETINTSESKDDKLHLATKCLDDINTAKLEKYFSAVKALSEILKSAAVECEHDDLVDLNLKYHSIDSGPFAGGQNKTKPA